MSAPDVQLALTEAAAKRLTESIRLVLGAMLDQRDRVIASVIEARDGRADEALGYRSWTEYVTAEFAGLLPRLNREDRQELVGELADAGMPTRAIGPIVGASQSTIVTDLGSREQKRSPERKVTGRDGKKYPVLPKGEPGKQRRRPLPDAYRAAIYELQKAAERIERLHADDRFPANQETLAGRYQSDLVRVAGIVNDAVMDLGAVER